MASDLRTGDSGADRRVLIVGGGFSGTMVAVNLAARGIASTIVERRGVAGLGTAFSTSDPAHILNIRAEQMSAFPDRPAHFADFAATRGSGPRDFAPRRDFGSYMGGLVDEALAGGLVSVAPHSAVAARLDGSGWTLDLDDGSTLEGDALVLALGNQQPQAFSPFADAGDLYVGNPWSDEARQALAHAADAQRSVLLIGTGLSMIDALLTLDRLGHRAPVIALSRRGRLPKETGDVAQAPVDRGELPQPRIVAILRWLRRRAATVGWQAAVESLRPHSHHLWQSLDLAEQRRFMRHARPFWDTHRHRIAPAVSAVVERRLADGSLRVLAGRLLAANRDGDCLHVTYRPRGEERTAAVVVGLAINCTGPLHAMSRTRNPLLRSMLDEGLIAPDALDIGIALGDGARAAGTPHLWAAGALTKARYWEIIAVPDIREQAAAIAADIERDLAR